MDEEHDVRAPQQPERPQRTALAAPRALPIVVGCGLALGLLALLLMSRGHQAAQIATPSASQASPMVSSIAPATAPSEQQSRVEPAGSPVTPATAPAQPSPVPHADATQPANEWAVQIPEAACIPADLPETGHVVDVLDGDTIRVLLDRDGRVYSVRYLGANAPALEGATAALGLEARKRSLQLVYRKQVILVRDITDTDASGTLLRYVLADRVFINHALIWEGFAQVEMPEPDTACLDVFLAAQQDAQANRRGIWSAGAMGTPTT